MQVRYWMALTGWLVCAYPGFMKAVATPDAVERHALITRQIELSVAVADQERQLEGWLTDPALTSPEIEALRRQLDMQRNELAKVEKSDGLERVAAAERVREAMNETQALLKTKIEALPEVRERIERVAADRRELVESGRRIRALHEAATKRSGADVDGKTE